MKNYFTAKLTRWFHWYLLEQDTINYATSLVLNIKIQLYKKLINVLEMYINPIRIHSKGHLSI